MSDKENVKIYKGKMWSGSSQGGVSENTSYRWHLCSDLKDDMHPEDATKGEGHLKCESFKNTGGRKGRASVEMWLDVVHPARKQNKDSS